MQALDRRSMLKVFTALSLTPYSAFADEKERTIHVVEAGTDRTGQPHKAARANSHLDFKVLTHETSGALFIMENRNMVRGGPPRHVHYEQEEWFYFVEGSDEVLMEVGEKKLRLKPGDSVFAREMCRTCGLTSVNSQGGCYLPSPRRRGLKVSSRRRVSRTLR